MVLFFEILLFISCLIIIGTVLLQPAKSGVSALGGTSQSIFGSTGGTTFLFRVSMFTAFFVMTVCLFLSWHKLRNAKSSFVDQVPAVSGAAPLANPSAPLTNPQTNPPGAPTSSPADSKAETTAPAAPNGTETKATEPKAEDKK